MDARELKISTAASDGLSEASFFSLYIKWGDSLRLPCENKIRRCI